MANGTPPSPPPATILSYARTIPKSIFLLYLIFLAVLFSLLLCFQYAIIHVIPVEFTLRHIYLNVNDPNLTSMFLSNYMHNPLDSSHITNNLYSTYLLIICIFILGTVILPALGSPMPPKFFPATFLVFLLALPFSISGISILSAPVMGKEWSSGFSGITYAFLGLFFFLMLSLVYRRVLKRRSDMTSRSMFLLFSGTFLTLTLVICQIFSELHLGWVNVYAHLGGFLLGLLIPSLMALVLTAQNHRQAAVAGIFIGLTLLTPSFFWLLMPV
ncbi:hypothetical protein FTO68_02455 [Methanocalculus taiwanensis]|uniref:Peptidase S54 rhomboid domain-containing protein n=1 Tax=Methanocalculus taiwanensis TaxID=106207 RepID=A0ABD4TI28_9EURY|nr:hypothetical protein [Methanocalculus taiwanensis]MCQ1537849.1 hypothetical protein [Methanocalculus taiwanensis]